MKDLKVVTLSVVVDSEDADYVAEQMADSHIAQMGYYCIECGYRDITSKEFKEVQAQVPDDVFGDDEDDIEVIEDEETGQREITIIKKDKSK